jgi:sialate O-acetylesterase
MKNTLSKVGRQLTAACLIIASTGIAVAGGFSYRDRLVPLNGKWRFSVGDSSAWADPRFDDSDWSRIGVREAWEYEGYRNYNGYAWYRREFSFRDDPDEPTYLVLGRIDDVDEVYVNGKRVGGTGHFPPNYVSAWNLDRVYALQPGVLHKGKDNVVAVRVYDGGSDGGIKSRTIGIYNSNLPRPAVILTGEWKFHPGDNPDWSRERADETDFVSVIVPSTWEDEGFADLDGFAWYRKSFHFEGKPEEDRMVFLMGKIDDTDEVYLNGHRIGRTGNLNDSDRHSGVGYYDSYRGYYFSADLLKEENVVAVRVHDHGGFGGIYEGPVGIISQSKYIDYWEMVRRDRGVIDSPGSFVRWVLGLD